MSKATFSPDFLEFARLEQEALEARLKAARAVISHPGEKGRALEGEVTRLLRSFLPKEYGVGAGFVAYHEGNEVKLSSQLDVVIYDAESSAPVITLPTCDVFPLEAVYGYLEVKASLCFSGKEEPADHSVEKCLIKNKQLRAMTDRRYLKPIEGSGVEAEVVREARPLPIRGYVFAFELSGKRGPQQVAERLANASQRLGPPTHLHGLYVGGLGFFWTVPTDKKDDPMRYAVRYVTSDRLWTFKKSLLEALERYTRRPPLWPPALAHYETVESAVLCVRPGKASRGGAPPSASG